MIIRLQRDSHNLTCHKKSRLLFALNLVRQAVTVHSSVCIIYDTTLRLYAEFVDCKYCTVTCRQFLNLTFAPRKTCNGFFHHSNLALLCYHVTQRFLLYTISGINQVFFSKSFKGRKCQVFLQHFFKKIFNIVYLLFIIYNDIIRLQLQLFLSSFLKKCIEKRLSSGSHFLYAPLSFILLIFPFH